MPKLQNPKMAVLVLEDVQNQLTSADRTKGLEKCLKLWNCSQWWIYVTLLQLKLACMELLVIHVNSDIANNFFYIHQIKPQPAEEN